MWHTQGHVRGARAFQTTCAMPPNIKKCHYIMSLQVLLSSLSINEAGVSVCAQG